MVMKAGTSKGTGPCRMAPSQCSGRTSALPYPLWRHVQLYNPLLEAQSNNLKWECSLLCSNLLSPLMIDVPWTRAVRVPPSGNPRPRKRGTPNCLLDLPPPDRNSHGAWGVRSTPTAGGSKAMNFRYAAAGSGSIRPFLYRKVRAPYHEDVAMAESSIPAGVELGRRPSRRS